MARSPERQAEYNAEILAEYHAWRSEAIRQMGGCCWQCGSTTKLEIDHIDLRTKKYTVTVGWRRPDIANELKKCQLLCKECHKKKHSTRKAYLRELGL